MQTIYVEVKKTEFCSFADVITEYADIVNAMPRGRKMQLMIKCTKKDSEKVFEILKREDYVFMAS